MARPMCQLPPSLVKAMEQHNVPRTDEGMQAAFGISYNSWRRISAGDAVSVSLADRLMRRLANTQGDANSR